MTSKLAVAGLYKHFGALEALRDIEMEVAAGEFIAIVGPSGCGKTTLLRLFAGLVPPSAGEIRAAGQPVEIGAAVDVGQIAALAALEDHHAAGRGQRFARGYVKPNMIERCFFDLRRAGCGHGEGTRIGLVRITNDCSTE